MIVRIKNCSKPTLHWYRPFVGKTFRVRTLENSSDERKDIPLGIGYRDVYKVISDSDTFHGKVLLKKDCENLR